MSPEANLIQDWINRHGGPRRFEPGVRASFYHARDYLEKFGIRLHLHDGRCRILDGKRWRRLSWPEVVKLVDQHRIAEGLEPLKPKAVRQ
ncbi:hypothetical protein [Mesorhizobium sp. RMAD-H1]|uniref:hypothetical protein n=1 Tax=Mesorhizobium sp. RMAD-H1 TaxID=2587065 RepID=UPI001607DB22|nr:hypothetical protein [Mesorhizobium sp. RMAD-H1]MBB2973973.1 hypothetical protein [Mesorhizobium sp. RMAD-H1]